MKPRVRKVVLALALTTSVLGCWKVQVVNEASEGAVSPLANDRWYHGVVNGLVDLTGPVLLKDVCPSGWTRISVHTSFLNTVVSMITASLYNPQTVTIRCSTGAAWDAVIDWHGRVAWLSPRP